MSFPYFTKFYKIMTPIECDNTYVYIMQYIQLNQLRKTIQRYAQNNQKDTFKRKKHKQEKKAGLSLNILNML